MKRALRGCILFVALLPVLGWAQSFNATITGSVIDQSGAVVPNAALTLTAVGTGVAAKVTSGSDGLFRFPNLVAGAYELKASAKGFRDYVQRGISVNINETVTVNIELELGTAIQTVEVTANASPLNFENAEVKQVVTPNSIQDLPLLVAGNQRSAAAFAILMPGVSTGGGATPFDARINGGLQTGDEAVLDGVSMQQGLMNQGGMISIYWDFPISPDTVSEVSVLTSNYEPQYGNTTSAVITAVTKSGTDKYRGSAYELLRNTVLNSRSYGAPKRAQDLENDWGFTIGGPIKIPKWPWASSRRKSFFFLGFDQWYVRGGTTNPVISIPSLKERVGDFSDWVDGTGKLIPVYDPATTRPLDPTKPLSAGNVIRDQFMGCDGKTPNVICPTDPRLQNSLAKQWIQYLPNPTFSGTQNNYVVPIPFSNLGGSSVDHKSLPTLKIDYYIGEKDHFAAILYLSRVVFGSVTSLPPQIAAEDHSYDYPGSHGSWVNRLNWDHTFTPTFVNALNYGYLNFAGVRDCVDRAYVDKVPQIPGVGSHFAPSVLQFQDFATMGCNAYNYERRPTNIVNDLATWVHGKHTIKFGGELRKLELTNLVTSNSSGTFNFMRLNTGLLGVNSGSDYASFLLEQVSSASALFNTVDTFYARGSQWDLNVGDTWKVTPKLSLNIGLRYDVATPSVDKFDHLAFFDPLGANPGAGNRPGRMAWAGTSYGAAGFPRRHPENTWYGGFAPRLGLAYSLNPKTVVRAGYGIFYTQAFYPDWAGGMSLDGFNASPSFSSSLGGMEATFLLSQGFPQNFEHPAFIDSSFRNGQNAPNYRPFDANRLAYAQQWNLAVERQFTDNFYISAAYVANKGTRLPSRTAPLNVLSPSLLSMSDRLYDQFTPGSGQTSLDGVTIPYPGWIEQMTGCAPTVAQALLPYPQYCGGIYGENENAGNSTYHSFQLKAEKRFAHGVWFLGSYTVSKLITDATGTQSAAYTWSGAEGSITPYERKRNKAIGLDDVPQLLSLTLIYDLPIGRGKRWRDKGGIVDKLVGGWEISSIFRTSSGIPFFFRSSNCKVPGQFGVACIPGTIPGADPWAQAKGSFDPTRPLFNRAAFENAGSSGFQFDYGQGPRISNLRGFGFHNHDFALIKNTRVTERVGIQFRAEAFNIWNWHVFTCQNQCFGNNGFTTDIASPSFGRWNGAVSAPRNIQLGMKIRF